MRRVLSLLLLLATLVTAGTASGRAPAGGESKIPITTKSEEARRLYLEARDLFDKLHLPEAQAKYREAVEADPEFALGYYGLAQTAQTAAEFFDGLKRAVALADEVSEPERHMILGLQAGANADPAGQRKHYEALVRDFPDDERGHYLLGNYFNGVPEYERAIEQYRKAVEINPAFSPAYNLLGYAYRFLERYDDSEKAFQRYIELLPKEPNPYDSYAELLMRTGRFEHSIENYRKALEIDPEFNASRIGIGNNQIFLGRPAAARETFREMYERAGNDGLRRTALFWTAVSYLHEGEREEALETVRRMSEIAKASGDRVAVSGDLALIGNILLETGGDAEEALDRFKESVQEIEAADAPDPVKETARRNLAYSEALIALRAGDLALAKDKASAYRTAVEPLGVPGEVQLMHELAGRIALADGDAERALTELALASQQDPRILWETAHAYRQAGNEERAREMERKAAEFNQLSLPYAFVRNEARQALASS